MTFIEQDKKSGYSWMAIAFVVLLGVEVFAGIFFYSQSVNSRHETAQAIKSLRESEAENANLKAGLAVASGAENVKKVAGELGLVLEKNPEYARMAETVSLFYPKDDRKGL